MLNKFLVHRCSIYIYISVYIIRGNPLYIHDTSRAGLKTASCIIHAGTYSSRISNRKRKQFKNHCNYHDSPSLPYLCTLWNERNSFSNISGYLQKKNKEKILFFIPRYIFYPSILPSRTISFEKINFLIYDRHNRNIRYVQFWMYRKNTRYIRRKINFLRKRISNIVE